MNYSRDHHFEIVNFFPKTSIFRSVTCFLVLVVYLLATPSVYADDLLIFHHIPKNGGTTINHILDQQFDKKSIYPDELFFRIGEKSPKELYHYKFIRGHFYFTQLKHLKAIRITFLREPIHRTFSAYRYYIECRHPKERKDEFGRRFFRRKRPMPLFVIKNPQCLFLSSLDRRDPSITMAQHLESAKYNVQHCFFFVGLTERMEESLKTLYHLMGFGAFTQAPRLNATQPPKEQYPEKLIRRVQKRNWADIELYTFAQKLYKEKLVQTQLYQASRPSSDNIVGDF